MLGHPWIQFWIFMQLYKNTMYIEPNSSKQERIEDMVRIAQIKKSMSNSNDHPNFRHHFFKPNSRDL
jgi:hypothetical protein